MQRFENLKYFFVSYDKMVPKNKYETNVLGETFCRKPSLLNDSLISTKPL